MQQQQQHDAPFTDSSLEFFNELMRFDFDDNNDELFLVLDADERQQQQQEEAVEITTVTPVVQTEIPLKATTTAIDLLLEAGAAIEQRPAARKRPRAEEEEERSFINIMPVTERRWKNYGRWRVHIDRVTRKKDKANKSRDKVGKKRQTIWHSHDYQTAEDAARAADQFMVACYGAAVHNWQLNFPYDLETVYMAPGGVPDYVFRVLEERYELKSGLREHWERVKSRRLK